MIIPAIIPEQFSDIENKVSLVKDYAKRVQIDVVDGYFAPNKTWPIINGDNFDQLVKGDAALPFRDQVQYEIHLMVQDPIDYIASWLKVGVDAIVAHASMLEQPHKTRDLVKSNNCEFGIAITPMEYALVDDSIFELADFVQVMGSNQIGQSGVSLSSESVDIVKHLSKNLTKPIAVDIGVNSDTIQILQKAGATRFVSGSAVFGKPQAN